MSKLFVSSVLFALAVAGCGRVQEYYEDTVSHSVKVKGGLFRREAIVFRSPSFDPQLARWQRGVTLSARNTISDGDTFAVRTQSEIYLVNVQRQQCRPDRVQYKWKTLGEGDSHVSEDSVNITLPKLKIYWSCASPGRGHIYAAPFFLKQPPEYQIGVPFLHKNLDDIAPGEIETIRYTSYPWEI